MDEIRANPGDSHVTETDAVAALRGAAGRGSRAALLATSSPGVPVVA